MANRGSGETTFLTRLGLFLIASSFSHCSILPRLKEPHTLAANSSLDQGRSKGRELHHGRFLIGQHSPQSAQLKGRKSTGILMDVDTEYQADMGWSRSEQPQGQIEDLSLVKPDNGAVEKILEMDPKVECTGDSMKLQVQTSSTRGSLLFVDRGSRLSPLPLSKLPPSCGYTVKSTGRDMELVAPYDGCFVTHEEDSYILPLIWLGLPVRMSCPLVGKSSSNPPMVTCHTGGMVVKLEWTLPVAKIKVKLTGNWEPLMNASPRCGFSVVEHPEGVVISVHYAPCLEAKDGMYTFELAGDGETKISCPLLSSAQTELTKIPGKVQNLQRPSEGMHAPAHPSQYAIPQVPDFSPNPEVPNKPYQGQYIDEPRIPYYPLDPTSPTHPPQRPVTKAADEHQFQQTFPHPKLPLNPEGQVPQPFIPNKKPNQGPKDIDEPQLPYFPWNPNFFNPYPANPDTKPAPTVHPPHSPVTKAADEHQFQQTFPNPKLPLNPEGQVPQPFIPNKKPNQGPKDIDEPQLPYFPWNPNFFNPYPENPDTKPAPTVHPPHSPVTKAADGRKFQQMVPNPKLPLNPEGQVPQPFIPKKKPNQGPKDIDEPQLPYFPWNPNFFNPYPANPDTKPAPTVHPPHSPVTKAADEHQFQLPHPKLPLNSEGEVPQQYIPSPVHPWPAQPEVPYGQEKRPLPSIYPPIVRTTKEHSRHPFHPSNHPYWPIQKPLEPVSKPDGQDPKPLYPVPFYPLQPQSTASKVPQVKPVYPSYPEKQLPQTPVLPRPGISEEMQRPVYPFWPEGPYQVPVPPTQLTPKLPPNGQVKQPPHAPESKEPSQTKVYPSFMPFPLYPVPENIPAEKPTAVPNTPTNETPKGQVHKPYRPSSVKPSEGQVPHPFNPYFYPHQPLPLSPINSMQKPQQIEQGPHQGLLNMPPVHCPQYCQSGLSNCCPQIAFHQHVHHIVPIGLDGKDTPPGLPFIPSLAYSGFGNSMASANLQTQTEAMKIQAPQTQTEAPPGLPVIPSLAYSGFGNSMASAILPQTQTEAMKIQAPQIQTEAVTIQASLPISPQTLPSGNEGQQYLMPPDGHPASRSEIHSREHSNPKNSIYRKSVPNLKDHNWPNLSLKEELQKLPESYFQTHYNVPSEPQDPGNKQVNPVVKLVQDNVKLQEQQNGNLTVGEMDNKSWSKFMSYLSQYLLHRGKQQQQQQQRYHEPLPSLRTFSDNTGSAHPTVRRKLDDLLVPYSMLQEAQAPTYNKSADQNTIQPSVSDSKISAQHEQNVNAHSVPNKYVLLQHGPPGREPHGFDESPLPLRDLVHDIDFLHPENLNPEQENPQLLKRLRTGISNPLTDNGKYRRGPVDKSEGFPLRFHSSDGLHHEHLLKKPSFGALESLKDFWKPMIPIGSRQRIHPQFPGDAFQQWSSAADEQANGPNKPFTQGEILKLT